MLVKLICPACKKEIFKAEAGWQCPACQRLFGYRQGVLSFLDPDNAFNPGAHEDKQKQAWTDTAQLRNRIRQSKLLSLLNLFRIKCSLSGRRDRIFYNEMHGGERDRLILDLGCGGGRHYFCDYGKVVGIDPVLELLQISRTIYDEVYHGSALNLPFADGSFDYVVSSDVIGHIPAECKDPLFAEMHRVLKPGGRTVRVIETDSTNRWFRFAHQYPELFREYFVDRPGHIGLEMPSQLRQRFLKHGFKEITFKKFSGAIQECGTFAGFFDNEFGTQSEIVSLFAGADRLLAKNLLVKEVVNLLLEPLARLEDWFSPFDHGSGAMVVFEK